MLYLLILELEKEVLILQNEFLWISNIKNMVWFSNVRNSFVISEIKF